MSGDVAHANALAWVVKSLNPRRPNWPTGKNLDRGHYAVKDSKRHGLRRVLQGTFVPTCKTVTVHAVSYWIQI